MNRAGIKITHGFLHQVLNLSDDVHIDCIVVREKDRFYNQFHIMLSGENLKFTEHWEGSDMLIHPIEDFQK